MNRVSIVFVLLTLTWLNEIYADDSGAIKRLGTAPYASPAEQIKTQKVLLRTRDGYYLRAMLGGGDKVVADTRDPKTSEVFTMEWVSNSAVRFRTRDGYYVGARLGGGDAVDATVKEPLTSEVFTLEWQDKDRTRVRLRTREGFYVHPIDGGGGGVDARTRTPKTSEVFTLVAAT